MSDSVSPPLEGRTIMIVEDEYFQAEDMGQALVQAGAHLVGPCASIPAAWGMLPSASVIDAAVLDINLRGQDVFPFAEKLADLGIPFLFATGYDRGVVPEAYRDAMLIEKPFGSSQLINALANICASPRPDA